MANHSAVQASAPKETMWPDFSAYGVKLVVRVLADKSRVFAFVGSVSDINLIAQRAVSIGFRFHDRDATLTKDATQNGKLDAAAIKQAFPESFFRPTQLSEIASIVKTTAESGRERRQAAALLKATPIGCNYLGESVLENVNGRFVFSSTASNDVVREDAGDAARWFRYAATSSQSDKEIFRDRVAEGMVRDILENGRRYNVADFARLVEHCLGSGSTTERDDRNAAQVFGIALQEALEAACIRKLASTPNENDAFVVAVALTEGMPTQNAQSSVRRSLQQYSTPFPIAQAVQRILGDVAGKVVYEPTAGNGSLVSQLSARGAKIAANEIDPSRGRQLRRVLGDGATVTYLDATTHVAPQCDIVVTNPPFGGLPQGQRFESSHFRATARETQLFVRRLDHLISLTALEGRNMRGLAVLVIAGDNPVQTRDDPGKVLPGSAYFFDYLDDHYHVHDAVEVEAGLYKRFGAEYPIRLVVVGDRRRVREEQVERRRSLPVLRSFEAIREWSDATRVRVEAARAHTELLDEVAPDVTEPQIEIAVEISANIDARAENALQAPYVSAAYGEPTTMIPRHLVAAQFAAFSRLKAECGDINDFVSNKLRVPREKLAGVLSPEQFDAVALAIWRMERNQGFLVGDETGIGKGRVMAALMRFGVVNGKLPIFVTEKANLFTDIWRDLCDVGGDDIRPLLLNSDGRVRDIKTNTEVFRTPANELERVLSFESRDEEPRRVLEELGYDAVFATYSQFSTLGNRRTAFLQRIAPNQLLLLDEAQNAIGEDSNMGTAIRAASAVASGVIYSSATYAKRANDFRLYGPLFRRAHSFREALDTESIRGVASKGGEAVLESISTMLVQDGAMIRRENDLTQVTFESAQPSKALLERNEVIATRFADAALAMAKFGGDIDKIIRRVNNERKEAYKTLPIEVTKGKRLGVSHTNFGSRLYQLQRQLSLVLNTEFAVERAKEALEKGRKPVFAVEQTMQTLIEEIYADDGEALSGVAIGKEPPTLRDLMARAWMRMQTVRDTGPYGSPMTKSVGRLLDDTLPRNATVPQQEAHAIKRQALQKFIANTTALIDAIPDVPAYPLDYFRMRLAEAGYRVVEISGRKTELQRIVGEAEYRLVERNDDRLKAIHAFNSGEADAIMLTRAGMTGLSLHASVSFKDQRQRELLEVQIPNNVAERMQLFGRVNRRGQVVGPITTTLGTGLPGDTRILAMQAKKLARLSATTTSNRESKIGDDVPDLLNFIGEAIARRWVEDNTDIAEILGLGDDATNDSNDPTFVINRLLSRLCLIPNIDQQRAVIEELDVAFQHEMRVMAERGENPFALAEQDWGATIESTSLFSGVEQPSYDSEFDRPVYANCVSYEVTTDPLDSTAVCERINAELSRGLSVITESVKAEALNHAARWGVLDSFEEEELKRVTQYAARVGESLAAARDTLVKQRNYALEESDFSSLDDALTSKVRNAVQVSHEKLRFFTELLSMSQGGITPGATLSVTRDTEDGETMRFVVLGLRIPEPNVYTKLGRWELKVLPVGGSARDIRTVSFHALFRARQSASQPLQFVVSSQATLRAVIDKFAEKTTRIANRVVLSGNLVAAAAQSAETGSGVAGIVTLANGNKLRGIIFPESVTLKKLREQPIKITDYLVAAELASSILAKGRVLVISTASKEFVEASGEKRDECVVKVYESQGRRLARVSVYGSGWKHLVTDQGVCEAVGENLDARKGEAFVGTRGEMHSAPFPVSRLADVLEAIGRQGAELHVSGSLREQYNDALARLQALRTVSTDTAFSRAAA